MDVPTYRNLNIRRAVGVLGFPPRLKRYHLACKQTPTTTASIAATDTDRANTTNLSYRDDMSSRYPSLEGMEIAIPPYDHRDSGFSIAEYERTADGYDPRALPALPRPLPVHNP